MESDIKEKAEELWEKGDLDELYQLLIPYIEKKEPFALNLFSSFSLASFKESDEEFARRAIKQKKIASEGGIAQASYIMGVNYLYGDDVPQDYKKASMYFERAIAQGHSYTKFTYGFSLYYGNDGNIKDELRGLALMQEASVEGIDKAAIELGLINAAQ